jgi:hypothetical protein
MSKSVSIKNRGQRGATAVVPSWLLEEPEHKCPRCGADTDKLFGAKNICSDCEDHESGPSDEWWNLQHGN